MIPVGPIGYDDLSPTIDAIAKRLEAGDTSILLQLNSPGGSVYAGLDFIAVLDELHKSGIRIQCVVNTRAFSMAAVILQACDDRYITPRSTILVHNASVSDVSGNAHELAEIVQILNALNKSMAQLVSARIGMPLAEYEERIRDGAWTMASGEALRVGMVDEVVNARDLPPLAD
jgi:ATP-dependent protease ClpP protease subunit